MQIISHPRRVAWSLFGRAQLGDVRRVRGLVDLVAGLISKPRGRISQAFSTPKERERAYRFVENPRVQVAALLLAMAAACRRTIERLSWAFIIIDGSSLKLADPHCMKNFGQVGAHSKGARGIKVISAYAVGDDGTPIGVPWQEYWARPKRVRRGTKVEDNRRRKTAEKETRRWVDVIWGVVRNVATKNLWFLVDREGDARPILETLLSTGQRFTVRSTHDRLLSQQVRGRKCYLHSAMRKTSVRGMFTVDVPGGHKRQARQARMVVRAAEQEVLLRDRHRKTSTTVRVSVVWAREKGTTPRGEDPLDWMLFTNAPILTKTDVLAVVRSYRMRWRIEDFHKAWKSGHCHVEDMQLHTLKSATIFATMHAAIAARVERLKHLARQEPDAKASTEISVDEHRALVALVEAEMNKPPVAGGRRQKTYVVSSYTSITIHEVVDWIARLGGYTGKSSGGPPGSSTIGRGLELVIQAARLLAVVDGARRSDQ